MAEGWKGGVLGRKGLREKLPRGGSAREEGPHQTNGEETVPPGRRLRCVLPSWLQRRPLLLFEVRR